MNADVKSNLIKNVKKLRREKNLSQRILSELLGLDSSYFSKFERGIINISLDKIILIANYFNVEFAQLFK